MPLGETSSVTLRINLSKSVKPQNDIFQAKMVSKTLPKNANFEGRALVDQINKENVIDDSATSTYTFKKTSGTPKGH